MSLFNMGSLMVKLDLDAGAFITGMSGATAAVHTFQKATGKTNMVLSNLALAFSAIGIGSVISDMVMAGETMTQLDRKLQVLTRSMRENNGIAADAGETYEYLRWTALKTGSAFDNLSKSYMQLMPTAVSTGLAVDTVRKAIEGTIGAGALMGASNEEMHRAFVAIRQVVGKNMLQMEELRGQLGEALPNSMLIVADGLTQLVNKTEMTSAGMTVLSAESIALRKELGLVGDESEVTVAKLNKVITEGKISGELFIKAWAAGTAEFMRFSELATTTVSGQMNNLKTIVETGVGSFMRDSGLNTELAAMVASFNEYMDETVSVSKERAKEIGDEITSTFYNFIQAIARFLDEAMGFNQAIINGIKAVAGYLVDTAQSLLGWMPAWMVEAGIIGYLFFGRLGPKGYAARGGIIGLAIGANEIKSAIDVTKAENEGGLRKAAFTALQSGSLTGDLTNSLVIRDAFDQLVGGGDSISKILDMPLEQRAGALSSWMEALDAERSALTGHIARLNEELAAIPSNRQFLINAKRSEIRDAQDEMTVLSKQYDLLGGNLDYVNWKLGGEKTDESQRIMGPLEKAVENWRKETSQWADDAQAKVADAMQTTVGMTKKMTAGTELGKLSSAELNQFQNSLLGIIETNSSETLGSEAARSSMVRYMTERNKYFGENGKFAGVLNDPASVDIIKKQYGLSPDEIARGLAMREMKNQGKMGSYESEAARAADFRQRSAAFDKLSSDFLAAGGDQKVVEELRANLNMENDAALKKFNDAADREIEKMRRKALKEKALDVKQLLRESDMNKRAMEAYVTMASGNPAAIAGLAAQEDLAVAKGEMDAGDRVTTLSQEELLTRSILAMREDMGRAVGEARLQISAMSDEGYQGALMEQDVLEQQYRILQQQFQTRRAMSGELVTKELELSNEALRTEQERLRTIQRTAAAYKEYLKGRVEEIRLDTERKRLDLMVAYSPDYIAARRENDEYSGKLELAEIYYQYSLSMEDRLSLSRGENIRGFTDMFVNGLMEIGEGTESLRETFADLFADLARMVKKFFLEWAVQQAMVWGMKQLGFFAGGAATGGPTSLIPSGSPIMGDLYHTGGIAGAGALVGQGRTVPADIFANAARYHTGGLLPSEVPIIAQRGEGIFTPKQMENADRLLTSALNVAQNDREITQNINVTVNASGGTPEQNEDLAARIGSRIRDEMRGMVVGELRQQMRPGGMLNGMS